MVCLVFLYRYIDLMRNMLKMNLHLCLIKSALHQKCILDSECIASYATAVPLTKELKYPLDSMLFCLKPN